MGKSDGAGFGRASYHSYLAQMLVFWLSGLAVRPHFPPEISASGILHLAVTPSLEIICSLALGLLLYQLSPGLTGARRRVGTG